MPVVLHIDGCPLTLRDCLQVLRSCGSLPATIGAVLREHIIDRALQNSPALAEAWTQDPSLPELPAAGDGGTTEPDRDLLRRQIRDELALSEKVALQELQDRHQAPTLDALAEVLASRGQDLASMREQIRRQLSVELLKHQIAAQRLPAYFLERAPFLERVTVSRLSICGLPAAEELLVNVRKRPDSFGEAAQECAQRLPGGFDVMTPLWVDLPEDVRDSVAAARAGEIFGPFAGPVAGIYWVFRLEARWNALLDDPQVARILRDELFEQWIATQLESARIEISLPPGYEFLAG